LSKYYVLWTRLHEKFGGAYVRIHAAGCGYCNEGRGALLGRGQNSGIWHGPYDHDEALRFAEGLAVSDTRPCRRCMRSVVDQIGHGPVAVPA